MALADICLWTPDVPLHKRLHSYQILAETKEKLKTWYKHREDFKLNDFILLDELNLN